MPAFHVDRNVRGWLTDAEAHALHRLAAGKRVVEIGSYHGLSSICMGKSAACVVCVDPFNIAPPNRPIDTLPSFRFNVIEAGLPDRVFPFVGRSSEICPLLRRDWFDMAFVDGDHRDAAVTNDIAAVLPLLKLGATLVLHDYGNHICPEVKPAVDRWWGDRPREIIDTLFVVTV